KMYHPSLVSANLSEAIFLPFPPVTVILSAFWLTVIVAAAPVSDRAVAAKRTAARKRNRFLALTIFLLWCNRYSQIQLAGLRASWMSSPDTGNDRPPRCVVK